MAANRFQNYVASQYSPEPLDALLQVGVMEKQDLAKNMGMLQEAVDYLNNIPAFGPRDTQWKNDVYNETAAKLQDVLKDGKSLKDPTTLYRINAIAKDAANSPKIKQVISDYKGWQEYNKSVQDRKNDKTYDPANDYFVQDKWVELGTNPNAPVQDMSPYTTVDPYIDFKKEVKDMMSQVKDSGGVMRDKAGNPIITLTPDGKFVYTQSGKGVKFSDLLSYGSQLGYLSEPAYNQMQREVKYGYETATPQYLNGVAGALSKLDKKNYTVNDIDLDKYSDFYTAKTIGNIAPFYTHWTDDMSGLSGDPGYTKPDENAGRVYALPPFKAPHDFEGKNVYVNSIGQLKVDKNSSADFKKKVAAGEIPIPTPLGGGFGSRAFMKLAEWIDRAAGTDYADFKDSPVQENLYNAAVQADPSKANEKDKVQVVNDYVKANMNQTVENMSSVPTEKGIGWFQNVFLGDKQTGQGKVYPNGIVNAFTIHDQEGNIIPGSKWAEKNTGKSISYGGDLTADWNAYETGSHTVYVEGTPYLISPDITTKQTADYFDNRVRSAQQNPTTLATEFENVSGSEAQKLGIQPGKYTSVWNVTDKRFDLYDANDKFKYHADPDSTGKLIYYAVTED